MIHMGLSVISVTFFFFFINVFPLTFSDPRTFEAGLFCSNSTPPRNPNYFADFTLVMRDLSEIVAANRSGHSFDNITKPPIYALAECHQDLSHTDCLLCFAVGRTRLPRCIPASAGRLYFDGCFLRYDDYDFFNESVNPSIDRANCSSSFGGREFVGEGEVEFWKRVVELVGNVTEGAVAKGGFAVGEVKGVYGLAQCWRTVSGGRCRDCLEKAAAEVNKCVPSVEGRGLNAGCYLRYSTTKFYENGSASSHHSSTSRTGVIVGICLGVTAFFMFLFFATYVWFRRSSELKRGNHKLGQLLNSFTKSRLNFKYEVLEKATDYFSHSTKIGQGGTGTVFKGTLADGQCVAVKRLFFNTRQWVDEFFNEVNLITGIQHKNLVKLLGCSIEGPESLLVYEYVPNKSLDQFLFDKDKPEILSWKQRFDVIVGTAEGLAYLHGGTEIRIIHRDIKSSNVLLDENLAPKIADFGLVRSFGADKSHLSTGIAGTLGYMAPEYLVRGQLTEKADVYSFGVLVLEIVCGRRNNVFAEDSSSLLQMVWQFHKTNRLLESVDPRLEGYFNAEEASRVLQIGLMCAQASAAQRPSMDKVVQMLVDRDTEIPQPYQPPFLSSTAPNSAAASSVTPYALNSPISKVEALSSNESSRILSSDEPSTSLESK